MSNTHVIQLHGPWDYTPLARTVLHPSGESRWEEGELPPPGHQKMPASWEDTLGTDFRGKVEYQRKFGCPTGLGAGDRVDLVVQQVDAWATVALNGQMLGTARVDAGPSRFDISQLLESRNQLSIIVELPRQTADSPAIVRPGREHLAGGLIGSVRLEIHPAE